MTAHSGGGGPGRGFALAEVLVALVILAVGLSGSAALQLFAVRLGQEARWREGAVTEARAIVDSLRMAGTSGAGSRTIDQTVLRWRTVGSTHTRSVIVDVVRGEEDRGAGRMTMTFRAVLR